MDRHLVDKRRQSERDVIRRLSQLPQLAVEHYLVEVAGLVEDASCAGGQQQHLPPIDIESDGPVPVWFHGVIRPLADPDPSRSQRNNMVSLAHLVLLEYQYLIEDAVALGFGAVIIHDSYEQ